MRALLRAMVERPTEPRLGIQSYPPEAGLYIRLLRSPGLHHASARDAWEFSSPTGEDRHRLDPPLEDTVVLLSSTDDGASLDKINESWTHTPFEIRGGLLPKLPLA